MNADLFRAEWMKMMRNRNALSFLVWIYPMAALTIVGLLLLSLFAEETQTMFRESQATWIVQLTGPWQLLTGFPQNIFIRLPFLAFTALLFAGEYQWQTWKHIVPRSRRVTLILVKFGALMALLALAMTVTSLIWGAGWGAGRLLLGETLGPSLSWASVREFLEGYLLAAGLALVGTLILAGYAALVAIRARSILGGVFISLGVAIVEPVSLILLMIAARILEAPRLVHLFRLTPTYNLDNLRSWLLRGAAGDLLPTTDFFGVVEASDDPLLFSLALLALWAVGLVALTAVAFRRQDLSG